MDKGNYIFTLEAIGQTRFSMLKIIDAHTIDEINKIPDGMNNNLIWNFVHTLATQQLLCYGLSGLKPRMDAEIINAYRKGTRPSEYVDQERLDIYKKMAFEMLDYFKGDLAKDIFKEYNRYETSFGVTLSNISEATQFNLAHETMHLGSMIVMRKLL